MHGRCCGQFWPRSVGAGRRRDGCVRAEWLSTLLGSDVGGQVEKSAATRWNAAPFVLGAMSAADPADSHPEMLESRSARLLCRRSDARDIVGHGRWRMGSRARGGRGVERSGRSRTPCRVADGEIAGRKRQSRRTVARLRRNGRSGQRRDATPCRSRAGAGERGARCVLSLQGGAPPSRGRRDGCRYTGSGNSIRSFATITLPRNAS